MNGETAARHCGYCGLENGPDANTCTGCGKGLAGVHGVAASSEVPPVLQPETPPALNGRFATLAFFVNLAAQIGASFVVGVFAFALRAINPKFLQGLDSGADARQNLFVLLALPTVLAGGGAVFMLSVRRVRPHLTDTSPTGAAWVVGSFRQMLTGFGIGSLVALGYLVLGGLSPSTETVEPGPIARMGMTPGLPQLIWLSVALLFAPLIEECLFRGVMYAGYRRSLGPVWAAILSTFLFWILHITEMFGYWPAMFGILALAATALWYRLRCRAIGPAVALHTGYDAVIAITAVISSYARQ